MGVAIPIGNYEGVVVVKFYFMALLFLFLSRQRRFVLLRFFCARREMRWASLGRYRYVLSYMYLPFDTKNNTPPPPPGHDLSNE
jgi:hypothetical protein